MKVKECFPAALLLVAASVVAGCGSPGLALVKEGPDDSFRGWYARSEVLPTAIAPRDRLVILRISHGNALGFHNSFELSQTTAEVKWRISNPVVLQGEKGDMLLLMRFIGTGGNAFLAAQPCTSANTTCMGRGAGVALPLPPPGQVAYAGHLHYRIDDQFPERGTRNLPVITQMTVTDDRADDIPAAVKKWPVLKGYTIAPAIATASGPVF